MGSAHPDSRAWKRHFRRFGATKWHCAPSYPWVRTPSGNGRTAKPRQTRLRLFIVSLGRRKRPVPIFDLIPWLWTDLGQKKKHRPLHFEFKLRLVFRRLPVIFHFGPNHLSICWDLYGSLCHVLLAFSFCHWYKAQRSVPAAPGGHWHQVAAQALDFWRFKEGSGLGDRPAQSIWFDLVLPTTEGIKPTSGKEMTNKN